MELELNETAGVTRMRLRVRAGSRKNEIVGVHGGALKVAVAAAPERGRANRAVVRLLAKALDLPQSALVLVAGQAAADKTILITLPAAKIAKRLLGEKTYPPSTIGT